MIKEGQKKKAKYWGKFEALCPPITPITKIWWVLFDPMKGLE